MEHMMCCTMTVTWSPRSHESVSVRQGSQCRTRIHIYGVHLQAIARAVVFSVKLGSVKLAVVLVGYAVVPVILQDAVEQNCLQKLWLRTTSTLVLGITVCVNELPLIRMHSMSK